MIFTAMMVVLVTASVIAAFLILSSGSFSEFRKNFQLYNRRHLPLVTLDGEIVQTKEELELQVELLKQKLDSKLSEIQTSKTKFTTAADSIKRLQTTSSEVKKYYEKLKEEISKSEQDCKKLQKHIEDYKRRREELRKEEMKTQQNLESMLDGKSIETSLVASTVDVQDLIKPVTQ